MVEGLTNEKKINPNYHHLFHIYIAAYFLAFDVVYIYFIENIRASIFFIYIKQQQEEKKPCFLYIHQYHIYPSSLLSQISRLCCSKSWLLLPATML